MRQSKKAIAIFVGIALVISLTVSPVAADSLLGWDLVDLGKHLDWASSSSYTTAWNYGVTTWNNYRPSVIREDTIWTVKDVDVYDYYEESNVCATTSQGGWIKFNSYKMDSFSAEKQKHCATHEIGHALGIGHLDPGDVMYMYCTTQIDLSFYDQASYDMAYQTY